MGLKWWTWFVVLFKTCHCLFFAPQFGCLIVFRLSNCTQNYTVCNWSKSSFSLNCNQGLVRACLNINSRLGHIDKLKVVIKTSNLDSILWDNDLHLPGFQIVRKSRKRGGWGVYIYLRTSINFTIRKDLSPKDFANSRDKQTPFQTLSS